MQIVPTTVGALPRLDPVTNRIKQQPGVVYKVDHPTMRDVVRALWWKSYQAKDDPDIDDVVTVYGFCCQQDVTFSQVFTYFKQFRFVADPQGRTLGGVVKSIELLRSFRQMRQLGGGDCDDFTVNVTAALLHANDIRRRKNQPPYSINHVYATAPGDTEPSHVFLAARHPNWPMSDDPAVHSRHGWIYLDIPFTDAPGLLAVNPQTGWKLQAVAPMPPI